MTTRATHRRPWVTIFVMLFVVATGIHALLNALFEDFKGRGEQEAESISEARRRGILVTELSVDPPELNGSGVRVRFDQAWIEERSLPSHFLVWIPTEKRTRGYRLHFTLARVEGAHESDVGCWPVDDHLYPSTIYGGPKTLHIIRLDDPHISELQIDFKRVDLNQRRGGPLIGRARFTPKPK